MLKYVDRAMCIMMKTSNMKRGLVSLLFIILIEPVWAHSDMITIKDFGDVRVCYSWGFWEHEERNKAQMIARLVEILSGELNYKEQICLSFSHYYVEDIIPKYRLWGRRGSMGDTLLFRVETKTYDVVKVLQLIEYAIKNKGTILKEQRDSTYESRYWGPVTETSFERARINKILGRKISPLVNKVLGNKIYRPKDEYDKVVEGFTYYFQNNKYHVCYSIQEGYGRELLELDNIYQFRSLTRPDGGLSSLLGIVFDTDSTFRVLTRDRYGENVDAQYWLSKRHTVENVKDVFEPYVLTEIGGQEVIIGVSRFFANKRNLLFRVKDDYLVQDLDVVIDKGKTL